jgi:hypothetical protein
VRVLAAICCALACGWAGAQSEPDAALPLPQYPAGGIASVSQADQALLDAKRARVAQEKAFEARRKVCYEKLLAENCLAPEREQNNLAVRRIRAVEVEARAFKRNQAARETAAKRAERQAAAAVDAPRREQDKALQSAQLQKKIARNEQTTRQFDADAPKRAERVKAADKRARDRREARAKKDAEEKARSAERAERVRAQEKKVADVLRRAKEKEEKAREKAAKAGSAGDGSAGSPIPGRS